MMMVGDISHDFCVCNVGTIYISYFKLKIDTRKISGITRNILVIVKEVKIVKHK